MPEAISVHREVAAIRLQMLELLPRFACSGKGLACEEMGRKIDFLTALCHAEDPHSPVRGGVGYAPHVLRTHQDVLRNSGVFDVIIRILQLPLRRHKVPGEMDEADNIPRRDLFQHCYDFIGAFCQGNAQNQQLSFQKMALYLSNMGIRSLNCADAISATLRDNALLLSQVRRPRCPAFTLGLLSSCIVFGAVIRSCLLGRRFVGPDTLQAHLLRGGRERRRERGGGTQASQTVKNEMTVSVQSSVT